MNPSPAHFAIIKQRMNNTDPTHRKAILGDPSGKFWLYDSQTGFDLTYPDTPSSIRPVPNYTLKTTTLPITIHPPKCALVIIDMQNFFLSPALGRSPESNGKMAEKKLLEYAIPAARKAGIQIVWMNWGLNEAEIQAMSPALLRAFGFETVLANELDSYSQVMTKLPVIDSHGINQNSHLLPDSSLHVEEEALGKNPRIYKGLGKNIGSVTLEDGSQIDGGGLLMKDSWNADLTPKLREAYEEGLRATPPDTWVHKNRMSGLWGATTPGLEFFEQKGINTLFFAGVNTDQCVGGSIQDAFSKGYDVVLLSDSAGTTSPHSSQESIEFNCAQTWGFCTSSKDFAEGLGL